MHQSPVKVAVLGAEEAAEAIYCSPDIFSTAAMRLGGDPVFEPPPFACPCTDGLLVVYTLKRVGLDGTIDVHGGYVVLRGEEWFGAPWETLIKPTTVASMLRCLGFYGGATKELPN